MRRTTGRYIAGNLFGDDYQAFVPHPLPPDPALEFSLQLEAVRDKANRALGRLDGITAILPNTTLFIYQYVRKEAVLSSQIEGTRSSISDLLLFELDEAPGVPIDDVQEVSNYVAAMQHGLDRLREGFPLSLRLIREIHEILLDSGRGHEKEPGQFRRSQVWLGGRTPALAEFVPPPPEHVMPCLDALEKFLHGDPVQTPVLTKAALAHVQFETIHPFKDGNGRLGRLLITLLLCAEDVVTQPMLYLSLYFKQNRQQYYDLLQTVRLTGDWEAWLAFFYEGIFQTAQSAVSTAQRLLALFDDDRQRLQNIGKSAGSAVRLHQLLQTRPVLRPSAAQAELNMSKTAVTNAITQMERLGIVHEITGKQRYRVYAYKRYIDILSEGTEPLTQ